MENPEIDDVFWQSYLEATEQTPDQVIERLRKNDAVLSVAEQVQARLYAALVEKVGVERANEMVGKLKATTVKDEERLAALRDQARQIARGSDGPN